MPRDPAGSPAGQATTFIMTVHGAVSGGDWPAQVPRAHRSTDQLLDRLLHR